MLSIVIFLLLLVIDQHHLSSFFHGVIHSMDSMLLKSSMKHCFLLV